MKKNHNKQNQMSRGLLRDNRPNGYNGYNSFKYSVLKNSEGINILDLKGIQVNDTEKCESVIKQTIEKTLKNNNFPIRIITHSVVEKIIVMKKVVSQYDNLKTITLDPCNPFTYCLVPK